MTTTVRRTNLLGDEVEIDLTEFRVDPFALLDELNALGSADAIAERMRAEHVRGYAGLSLRCPLAVYVQLHTGVTPSIGVGSWTPTRPDGDEPGPYFTFGRHVDAFVEAIDLDHYPDLARDPEEMINSDDPIPEVV